MRVCMGVVVVVEVVEVRGRETAVASGAGAGGIASVEEDKQVMMAIFGKSRTTSRGDLKKIAMTRVISLRR
jgi:hypothetical protein